VIVLIQFCNLYEAEKSFKKRDNTKLKKSLGRALEKRDEKVKNIGCTQLSQAVLKILFAFTELLITLPSIVALTDW